MICLCVRINLVRVQVKKGIITNKKKFYQLLKLRRCCHVTGQTATPLCILQILHSYSIEAKKKKWFIISTEQREYRASAMQWTCWAYQSLGNMESFLFKGWKWRADGRKPKQKTSVQNLVFFSFVNDYKSKTVQ